MSKDEDVLPFEEAFRVIKIDDETYEGAHRLRLPVNGARGVYGGHTVAQALLVAMEVAGPTFRPHSFHSYFIAAGDKRVPMTYKVERFAYDGQFVKVNIKAVQKGRNRLSCVVLLVPKIKFTPSAEEYQLPAPALEKRHSDPSSLHVIEHTDYIRNAYSSEFISHEEVPEENNQPFSQRWINVYSGISQNQSFTDPRFNYVGLANLSDSAFLTTMARVLHIPWNPTEKNPYTEYDQDRSALNLLKTSMNILHLYHYNAMSLDHHIYFSNLADDFDISRDWVCFTYQMRCLSNNRTLVRGFMYDKDNRCVATVVQEGLTYLYRGIADQVKL